MTTAFLIFFITDAPIRIPSTLECPGHGLPSARGSRLPGVCLTTPIAFCWSSNPRSNTGVCVFRLSIFTPTFSISWLSTTQSAVCSLTRANACIARCAMGHGPVYCLVVGSDVGRRIFAPPHRIYHRAHSTTMTRTFSQFWPANQPDSSPHSHLYSHQWTTVIKSTLPTSASQASRRLIAIRRRLPRLVFNAPIAPPLTTIRTKM